MMSGIYSLIGADSTARPISIQVGESLKASYVQSAGRLKETKNV